MIHALCEDQVRWQHRKATGTRRLASLAIKWSQHIGLQRPKNLTRPDLNVSAWMLLCGLLGEVEGHWDVNQTPGRKQRAQGEGVAAKFVHRTISRDVGISPPQAWKESGGIEDLWTLVMGASRCQCTGETD